MADVMHESLSFATSTMVSCGSTASICIESSTEQQEIGRVLAKVIFHVCNNRSFDFFGSERRTHEYVAKYKKYVEEVTAS